MLLAGAPLLQLHGPQLSAALTSLVESLPVSGVASLCKV